MRHREQEKLKLQLSNLTEGCMYAISRQRQAQMYCSVYRMSHSERRLPGLMKTRPRTAMPSARALATWRFTLGMSMLQLLSSFR